MMRIRLMVLEKSIRKLRIAIASSLMQGVKPNTKMAQAFDLCVLIETRLYAARKAL